MTQVIHGSHTLTLPYTVLTHDTHAACADTRLSPHPGSHVIVKAVPQNVHCLRAAFEMFNQYTQSYKAKKVQIN